VQVNTISLSGESQANKSAEIMEQAGRSFQVADLPYCARCGSNRPSEARLQTDKVALLINLHTYNPLSLTVNKHSTAKIPNFGNGYEWVDRSVVRWRRAVHLKSIVIVPGHHSHRWVKLSSSFLRRATYPQLLSRSPIMLIAHHIISQSISIQPHLPKTRSNLPRPERK
jgi:hypothetical protein